MLRWTASAALAALATFVPTSLVPTSLVHGSGRGPAPVTVARVEVPVPRWPSPFEGMLGISSGNIVVGAQSASGCRVALVRPARLQLVSERSAPCEDPLVSGQRAVPVESVEPAGSSVGEVRIAVLDPETGSFRLGPVVMRYGNISDGRPEWTYGAGDLWLYDVGTGGGAVGPHLPAEVPRISALTGAVLGRASMPTLTRIILAADADGLWFSPSLETGWLPGHPPDLLYFVPLGGTHPVVVQAGPPTRSGGTSIAYANWIVAAGHRAWVDVEVGRRAGSSVIETFPTPESAPRKVAEAPGSPRPSSIGLGPADVPPVLELPGVGLVALVPGWLGTAGAVGNGARSETLVRLDPATGESTRIASFSTVPDGLVEADAVIGGALYVLTAAGEPAALTLYRISPSSAGSG